MRRPDKSFVVFKETCRIISKTADPDAFCILLVLPYVLCSLRYGSSLRVEKVKGYFLAEQVHIQINNDISFYNKNLETTF